MGFSPPPVVKTPQRPSTLPSTGYGWLRVGELVPFKAVLLEESADIAAVLARDTGCEADVSRCLREQRHQVILLEISDGASLSGLELLAAEDRRGALVVVLSCWQRGQFQHLILP